MGHFLAVFTKVDEFVQNRSFLPEITPVLLFSYWTHHFLAIFKKIHEVFQNSVVSPRTARFVILALGTPLSSGFQQSAPVFTNQRFHPEISTFIYYRTGRTTI